MASGREALVDPLVDLADLVAVDAVDARRPGRAVQKGYLPYKFETLATGESCQSVDREECKRKCVKLSPVQWAVRL